MFIEKTITENGTYYYSHGTTEQLNLCIDEFVEKTCCEGDKTFKLYDSRDKLILFQHEFKKINEFTKLLVHIEMSDIACEYKQKIMTDINSYVMDVCNKLNKY